MPKYDENIKNLVKERLLTLPSNINFSIGDFGEFTRDQLIEEIDEESEVGKAAIDMQLDFIRKMPKILAKYGSS